MSTEPVSEKKRIEQITPEQTESLRTLAGILNEIKDSSPKAVAIKLERRPVLQDILLNVQAEERVNKVEPEKIYKLTRAERPITFDVASLTRINTNDEENVRHDIELGKELENREDGADDASDQEIESEEEIT